MELLSFMISITSLILVLILFILIISKLVKKKKLKYELFTYNKKKVCSGELIHIKNPTAREFSNCPYSKFNGTIYTILNWNNSNKNQHSTLYITVAENLFIRTNNYWLSIYDDKTKLTIGTLRWTTCQTTNHESIIKSKISAASGILQDYQNENIIIDSQENEVKLYVYTSGIKNTDINRYYN